MSIPVPDLSGLTFENMKELETLLGRPIGDLFKKIEGMAEGDLSGLSTDELVGFLWLRLRMEDPELTIADVWKMDLASLTLGAPDPLASSDSRGPIRSTG